MTRDDYIRIRYLVGLRGRAAINVLRGRPTVFGIELQRPPALIINTPNTLVSSVFVDGAKGAAIEVRS